MDQSTAVRFNYGVGLPAFGQLNHQGYWVNDNVCNWNGFFTYKREPSTRKRLFRSNPPARSTTRLPQLRSHGDTLCKSSPPPPPLDFASGKISQFTIHFLPLPLFFCLNSNNFFIWRCTKNGNGPYKLGENSSEWKLERSLMIYEFRMVDWDGFVLIRFTIFGRLELEENHIPIMCCSRGGFKFII